MGVRLKPSISPRERRAPPSNHYTLQQHLGGGTVCDETSRPRQVKMHFQCPPTWQQRPETRIVSINEASLYMKCLSTRRLFVVIINFSRHFLGASRPFSAPRICDSGVDLDHV